MSKDETLSLEDFRKAMLVEQPDSELNWRSPDEFILQNVSAQNEEDALRRIGLKMASLQQELTSASLALAPIDLALSSTLPEFQVQPSDALDTIAQLQLELAKCNAGLVGSDGLFAVEFQEQVDKQQRMERVGNLKRLLEALDQLANHQRLGAEFDLQLEQGDFLQACDSIQAMESCTAHLSQIQSSSSSNNGNSGEDSVSASQVAKACRVQWKIRRIALFARLDEAFKQALVFDPIKREFKIALDVVTPASPTPVRLERVVEAMQVLRILTNRLVERVLPKLVDMFLNPLLEGSDGNAFELQVNSTNINLPSISLVPFAEGENHGDDVGHVLENVQKLVRFVWSELFNRDSKLMVQLNLQSKLNPMLKTKLKLAIPQRFQDLPKFRIGVLDRVTKFDQDLMRMGCLGDRDEKLAQFVSEVDINFAKRLREQVAWECKQMLANTYLVEQRVDQAVEPDFFLGLGSFSVPGDMLISKAVREVVYIANRSLEDATKANEFSPTCMQFLVKASRDCFDLTKILLPFLRRQDLSCNPRVAMVHRNDLSYLAHHLVLLSHRHPDLSGLLITVDLAPPFFDDADRVFLAEVTLRSNEIEQNFTLSSFDGDYLAKIATKAEAIIKSWTETGLPKPLMEQAKASMGDALCHGAFSAICQHAGNLLVNDKDKRILLRKLTQFMEPICTRF
ncbi:hypothetical protein BASA81_002964 [Batrachochytrium salamandrivorans]|nr:hypothetical protein BASA81_002964 [Batrachochytrium salamandrivorans]